jgi:hypothetical protein
MFFTVYRNGRLDVFNVVLDVFHDVKFCISFAQILFQEYLCDAHPPCVLECLGIPDCFESAILCLCWSECLFRICPGFWK